MDAARFNPPSSGPPSDGGRFLPGQVLEERYRVIGLLGRGGMGEVYRADDLKLGQPVALKFLPEAFARDEARLERFFNEVRTARQVTHPNVCRVHDLGEVGGHHFLSMEYVDGEDLGTLLRRIGHVPKDKAVQIARQLCAGLAAAHDEGILHRDLKPANIMIDGRGRARITDFGLAGLAESIEGGEVRAGTPAYQAPEQLAGKEVSKASDIYALGLVLYELLTGERAFEASSATELAQMQQSTTPVSMSSHVDGLDDTIERIVLRCLDPDPRKRPESPLAISAALPGGDPLAAALAAGETPSPEMVANAGEKGGLSLPVALGLLAIILIGVTTEFVFRSRHATIARIGLPKPPAELRVSAEQTLEEIGHDASVGDTAWGLTSSPYYDWVRENDDSPSRWDNLESVRPHPVYYWYRQSPEWLDVRGSDLHVQESQPPLDIAGMATVRLDAEGRLLKLEVVPPAVRAVSTKSEIDWAPLLRRAELEPEALRAITPRANPQLQCEQRIAWEGGYGGPNDVLLHIEACGAAVMPLYFEVFAPWSDMYEQLRASGNEEGTSQDNQREDPLILVAVVFSIIGVVFIGSVLLARRNLRLGRADRRGAFRIAMFVLVLNLVWRALSANHVASAQREFSVIAEIMAHSLFVALLAWTFYVAAEPFVRRVWPNSMIAWRRLLEGRVRDPLIGRDALIGGAIVQLVIFARIGVQVFSNPPALPGSGPLSSIAGTTAWASAAVNNLGGPIVFGLGITTLVVLARIALRKNWLTWLVLTTILVTTLSLSMNSTDYPLPMPIAVLLFTTIWGSMFFTAIRFGLLAIVFAGIYAGMADMFRIFDPSGWYFGYVLAYLLVFLLAPAFYAFWISLGGKKLFRTDLLDS